ncbi:MAG: SAM-dependent methyltransferase [Chloroflexota bacterium]|nr:SAM-dependent methyltransferase [Chloroflexota bacterium]
MDLEAGFRRAPTRTPLPADGEPALVERIRAEISAAGRITFARFMDLALYDSELGYYRGRAERAGRAGDFLTAPETHPIFGAAIARQLDEIWRRMDRPARFVLREYGAGSGTLAVAILDALAGRGRLGRVAGSPGLAAAIRYAPVEVNPHRRAELSSRITAAGSGAALELELETDRPEAGAVVANEFLDALPVHRVVGRGAGALAELFVGWDGTGFVELAGEPSTPALARRFAEQGIVLAEGARAEVCLELDGWIGRVAQGLTRGAVVVVDYGHPAADLYGPARAAGTLLAYSGHRVHDDWALAVGRQDLTAQVDFSALERAASAAGLTPLGLTTQAEFLVGTGTDELLEAIRSDPMTSLEQWLAVRSAVARLLDPKAMGGFRVSLLGRGLAAEPPLAGLSFRLHP